MTDEQERAEFEAWLGVKPCCGAGHDLDGWHCVGYGPGTWDYITGEFS